MQRWSFRLTQTLRTFLRRGAMLLLVPVIATAVTISPLTTRSANAADLGSLSALTSFTNGLSSCAIETVGWVICPTMRSIAKLADYGFTYINQSFMKIDYNIQANDSGTFKAWDIMKNIANALFVVAFMVLIYSQLTGRGNGGYNIKRLLPRLIIAAIAVNISYYLCVVLIDITNILGDSILNILNGVADRVGTQIMPIDASPNPYVNGTLTQITSWILGKTAYAWIFLAPLAAVTVSIATISAATLILLIMRKTIVAVLILAAPVLFVAYLLPNLERFFYQGSRLFIQLLILYPIMAILLGAGQIVSATIVSIGANDANYRVSGDSYLSLNGGTGSAVTDMVAAAAAVLPLLAVWFLFKNMSSIMSTAGSRLSASIKSRRGSDDKDARVTGKATIGAANAKNANPLERMGRRQAFSRNRRHSSLAGSALDGEGTAGSQSGIKRGSGLNQNATQNALDAASRANEMTGEDAAKRLEELQNARIDGQADGIDIDSALANAVEGQNGKQDDEKHVTAKDLFNDLNKAHESKDKDRKFNAGPAPAGGGSEQSGSPQPTAPTTSYRAPSLAQSGNIVSGGAPAGGSTRIVAVPVQIDASSLLGQQNKQSSPDAIGQPPVSATEEKAKARAQKYLYEADQNVEQARDEIDILGRGKQAPDEPPHTSVSHDKEDEDHKDNR